MWRRVVNHEEVNDRLLSYIYSQQASKVTHGLLGSDTQLAQVGQGDPSIWFVVRFGLYVCIDRAENLLILDLFETRMLMVIKSKLSHICSLCFLTCKVTVAPASFIMQQSALRPASKAGTGGLCLHLHD